MTLVIAASLASGAFDWHGTLGLASALLILLIIVTGSTLKRRRFWRFAVQSLSQRRGRDWLRVSASVDAVSVVPQTEPIRGYAVETVGHVVTLTYFYRNPELQTGDYSRMFDKEKDAHAWAASIKGRNIVVHVDPNDASHSMVRNDDLEFLTSPGR